MKKSTVFAAALLAGASLSLGACSKKDKDESATDTEMSTTGNDVTASMATRAAGGGESGAAASEGVDGGGESEAMTNKPGEEGNPEEEQALTNKPGVNGSSDTGN